MKSFNKIFLFAFITIFFSVITSNAHATTLTINTTSTIDADTISGYDDVTIDAAGADITITLDETLNGVDWTFEDSVGGGTITFSGELETDGDITIDTTVTHAQGDVQGIEIESSGTLTITSDGSINVAGKGCIGNSNSWGRYHDLESNACTLGSSNSDSAGQGEGNGAGGAGGYDVGGKGKRTGNAAAFDEILNKNTGAGRDNEHLGSGGGGNNNRAGGAGGGLIVLDVDTLVVNGPINASGAGAGSAAGGGGGGVINIRAWTINISDVSLIDINGGNASTSASDRGGAGSGGLGIFRYGVDSGGNTASLTGANIATGGVNSGNSGQNGNTGGTHVALFSLPLKPSMTGIYNNQFNISRTPTINLSEYKSDGLKQSSAVVKFYSDALLNNLVATCTVNSGNAVAFNNSNCVDSESNAISQLAGFTKYYAQASYSNRRGSSTLSDAIGFTTAYTSSASTKAWHFNEGTPSNFYTFNSSALEVINSKVQLKDLDNTQDAILNFPTLSGSSFTKRRPITLTNSNGVSISNGAIRLEIDHQVGMQNDFDDIRFTDSSNNLIDYWVERKTDGAKAFVWVEIPTISTGNSTIYMYYGNNSVSSLSNPTNVTLFHEDFNLNSINDLDDSKWSINSGASNIWTITDNQLNINHGANAYGPGMKSVDEFSRPSDASYTLYLQNKSIWDNNRSGNDSFYYTTFKDTTNNYVGGTNDVYTLANNGTGGSGFLVNGAWSHQTNYIQVGTLYYNYVEVTSTGANAGYSTDGQAWTNFNSTTTATINDYTIGLMHHSGNYTIDDYFLIKKANVNSVIGSIQADGDTTGVEYTKALSKIGNDIFAKTKNIAITNSSGYAITDGNIFLTITYDSDMQADFDDIRFLDSQNNVLNYWIQNKTDSTSADVWVKVPSIPTGSSNINLLYGNNSVSTTSNGKNTFLLFEDFNGLSNWSELEDWTINGTAQSKWSLANDRLQLPHSGGNNWNRSMLSNTIYTRPENSSYTLYIQNKMNWYSNVSGYDALYVLSFKDTDGGIVGCNDCIYGIYNKGRDGHSGFIDRSTGWLDYENHITTGTWFYHNIEMTNTGGVGAHSTDGKTWTAMDGSNYTGIGETQIAIMQHSGNYYVDDMLLAKKANVSLSIGNEADTAAFTDVQVKPKLNNGVSLGTPYQLSHSITGNGSVAYTILVDLNSDGDTVDTNEGEYFINDSFEWTKVTDVSTQNNTISEINNWIGTFTTEVGSGNVYPVAYLISDGTQQVKIDSITMNYGADKATVSVSCDDDVTEGGTITCTASLDKAPSGGNFTTDYTTSNGTALAGSDYTTSSGTLTFNDGDDSSKTFTVVTTNDSVDEPNTETVNITLSNPNEYGQLGTDTDSFTITDNDAQPTLAVADQIVTENGGTQTVNIALTGASQSTITLNYTTTDLTASAGTDYTTTSGTLNIAAGQTGNQTISIPITDNLVDNPNETFRVDISGATNASITDANGTITINDNEATPSITVNDPSATEGSNVEFQISISPASSQDVTVQYTTANGTASSGTDYTTRSGTATIGAGATSTIIAVSTADDSNAEGSETILFNLSNPSNATIGDSQGSGSVNDNDSPAINISDLTVDENDGTATVVVTLTGQSDSNTSVDYATATSTAGASDFTATSGTLTWTAGQTGNKSFTVTLNDDALDEDDETFAVNLSNASNGSIADSQAIVTITDNDATPTITLSTSSNSIAEGESATLTATTSAVSGRDITVNLSYSGASSDDSNEPASITISAGQTTGTTTFSATDDDLDEDNESRTVSVSSVTYGTESGTQQAVITITDNDTAGITVTETSSSTEVTENGANDAYTVVLDSEPTDDVVVTLSDANGEVTLSVTELTFTSENWDTPQTVTVTAVDDDFDEDSHSDTISSSVASDDNNYNAFNISDISVSITDDDAAGYIIAKTGPDHRVVEGGATDTFTVVLNSAPVDDVVIDLTTTPSGQISTSPTSLTFTDENFDTPQTVTITATNDRVPESSLLAAVQLTPTTNDTDYDISIANQNVTVTDNDSAWVNITEADEDESASEDGDTKRYQFVLSSQPASPVSVRITTDSEVSSNVTLLSFHNQNAHAKAWNKPQIVTFTATDDDDIEGNHNAVIQFQVGGPNNYRNLPIPQLTIPIIDNDSNEVEEEEEVEQEEGPEGSPPPGEGSSTSGSSTSGSSTSGSSTSGSSTSGSSTNGSSTNGSSTNGSSTNGSSTNGSTTGNNRPERQIEITKLTAGSTQTVRPGARVKLRGRITKKPNGSHTAQWTQTSGPTVELSNIGALQPRFIAPSNFEGDSVTLGFKLTATTNADQKDATTSVIVRKKVDICLGNNCNNDDEKQVDPPKGPECNVIGMTSDGKAICEENDVPQDCPAGTVESMSIGGKRICNPFRKAPVITPIGDLVAIGFPFEDRGRGRLIVTNVSNLGETVIHKDMTDDDDNVVILEGSQRGDLFGHQIKICDFNGDGQDDIYVTAPNTRKGTGYLIEITRDSNNALEAETVGVITGGQHPLRTKFMECLNYNGGSGDELFLPVKLEGNSSRNANSSLSFSVADSGADITEDGQLIFASESEVDDSNVAESTTAFNGLSDETINSASQIDLSVTDFTSLDTDVEIDAMSSGDLNADGYDDLVLASTETCDVYVYFGQENMESQISTYNEIACQEGSNFTDLVIGDVNGDGIDDLILVFPDDGGDGGSIYILPGVEDMSEDDMSGGQTIYGSPDNPITGLILADTDGDGDSELVINNGNGGTSIIGGDGSVLDTGSGGNTPTTLGGGGVSTGCQLSTDNNSQAASLYWIVIMLSLSTLIIARKKQKPE